MTHPPLLHELLTDLDMFVCRKAPLLETAPDNFYVQLRESVAHLVCRGIQEGRREIVRWEAGNN